MKYLEEAIDTGCEYGKKYMELVSNDDKCAYTEEHHIVPVAFFRDVLGITTCRQASSPDMDRKNLVKLSKGHHLLAHYYLMKCARKCIRTQMVNAFRCTYKTGSVSEITEADVLARMKEIDRAYAKLKDGKVPHKDGVTGTVTKTSTSVCEWKDGKKVGRYVKKDRRGEIVELGDHDTGMRLRAWWRNGKLQSITMDDPSMISHFIEFRFGVDDDMVFKEGPNTACFRLPYNSKGGMEFYYPLYSHCDITKGGPFNKTRMKKGYYDQFSLACLARMPEILQALFPRHCQGLIKAYWADPYLPDLHAMEFETPVFEIPRLPESCMEKYNKFVELGYLEAA